MLARNVIGLRGLIQISPLPFPPPVVFVDSVKKQRADNNLSFSAERRPLHAPSHTLTFLLDRAAENSFFFFLILLFRPG